MQLYKKYNSYYVNFTCMNKNRNFHQLPIDNQERDSFSVCIDYRILRTRKILLNIN